MPIMSETPLVTIVTATRNRTSELVRALRSIENQSLGSFESLIVDDGSSEEILSHHRQVLGTLGPRFRLLQATSPGQIGRGPAATRQFGLLAARGKFVAFLDDDDVWPWERYLELATDALQRSEGGYFFGHLDGERSGKLQNPGWVPQPSSLTKGHALPCFAPVYELSVREVRTIAKRFMVHPSNSVIRREVALNMGGFFTGLWSSAEDVDFMLRALDVSNKVLYTPQPVAIYRLPTGNSVSLKETLDIHHLQRLMAAQHSRLMCRRQDIKDCARAVEAWTFREMAIRAFGSNRYVDARVLARQAFATCPGIGALRFWTSTWLKSRLASVRKPLSA
jgi:GT2 family glycosyltransferase